MQMCLNRKYDFKTAQASMVLVLFLTSPQTGFSVSNVNHIDNGLKSRNHQLARFSDDVTDPINPYNGRRLRGDGQG